jgi:D-arabinose 1-dehydrogenase-like Zn-dependent alcohol dehydrogenase
MPDGRMTLPPTGWSMGHENIGEVVETGLAFQPQGGDRVGAFTSSCGECWYCKNQWPSVCKSM